MTDPLELLDRLLDDLPYHRITEIRTALVAEREAHAREVAGLRERLAGAVVFNIDGEINPKFCIYQCSDLSWEVQRESGEVIVDSLPTADAAFAALAAVKEHP